MNLKTLTMRCQSLESTRAQTDQYPIVLFIGTPEADAKAEQLGKDLKVLRIRWKF